MVTNRSSGRPNQFPSNGPHRLARNDEVPRPLKKSEYAIVFASRQAQIGWRDLSATNRNALAESWDFLTKSPLQPTLTNYKLKADLAVITVNGQTFDRWQHKPTARSDARIWFYVDGRTVWLENVFTSHPNQTKK